MTRAEKAFHYITFLGSLFLFFNILYFMISANIVKGKTFQINLKNHLLGKSTFLDNWNKDYHINQLKSYLKYKNGQRGKNSKIPTLDIIISHELIPMTDKEVEHHKPNPRNIIKTIGKYYIVIKSSSLADYPKRRLAWNPKGEEIIVNFQVMAKVKSLFDVRSLKTRYQKGLIYSVKCKWGNHCH